MDGIHLQMPLTLQSFPTVYRLLKWSGAPMPNYVHSVFGLRVWPAIVVLLILGHTIYAVFSYVVYVFVLSRLSTPPSVVATPEVTSPYYLQIVLVITMSILASWPSLTATCSSYELLRTPHADDTLARLSRYPDAVLRFQGTIAIAQRATLVFLTISSVAHIALAIIAGSRSDVYGASYATAGTIFSLFAYPLLSAVGLLLVLLCEAHIADYRLLRQGIKHNELSTKLARRQYSTTRKLVARTSEGASLVFAILFGGTVLLLALYSSILLFAPTRADLTRAFFAAPLLFMVTWCVVLVAQFARVTAAARRHADEAGQGFLAESIEKKVAYALYLQLSRGGMAVYGYVLDYKFGMVMGLCLAALVLLVIQRLFSLITWT